jgi:hypothetical protein
VVESIGGVFDREQEGMAFVGDADAFVAQMVCGLAVKALL